MCFSEEEEVAKVVHKTSLEVKSIFQEAAPQHNREGNALSHAKQIKFCRPARNGRSFLFM